MTEAAPVSATPAARWPEGATRALRIPVSDIVPSKTNPRTSFPAADLAELAASVKKHGIFQPLLLRDHPSKDDVWELVDGERRLRAAKQVGLLDVPAVVGAFNDEEVMEIQIVSFLQRKDLTALEEAQCFNTLLVKKYTHERIAEKVGRSVQYVRDRCRLLSLVKGAVELLQAKRIEVGHAILLARLSPEDQVRTIREPESSNGFYDAARDSGLWQRQRALPVTSEQLGDDYDPEENEVEGSGELKAVSVRELAAWIDRHVKLRPEAPEIAELFPETAAIVRAADEAHEGEKPIKVIHITFEHQLPDDVKKVEGPKVYGPRSWVRADGKAGSKICASSVAGIVIAGPARGEGFHVCTAKKTCQVHYKEEIAAAKKRQADVDESGATGAERAALEKSAIEKQKAAEAERLASLRRAIPAIQMALAEKVKTAPLAKLFAEILSALEWTAKQGLKAADRLIPAGKTPESFVRNIALAVISSPTSWQPEYHMEDIANVCKKYGLDVAKICASANENDAATKAARKKPAKAKTAKAQAGKAKK